MAKYDVTVRGEVYADDPIKALEKIIEMSKKSADNEDIWENMLIGENFNITIDFSLYKGED